MYLKSDIITGPVTAGVAPCQSFSFKGIQVILGNDAVGHKVQPDPIVTDKSDLNQSHPEEIPGLYPSCAVTRSMSKQEENDEIKIAHEIVSNNSEK